MHARLVHKSLSQAEVEVLFKLLNERFEVVEEVIRDDEHKEEDVIGGWKYWDENDSNNSSKEKRVSNSSKRDMLMSILSVDLPVQYDANFIKSIGFERWEALKEIIKNIRWRRGKSLFAFRISFLGSPTIAFSIVHGGSGKVFNKAIESIEYVADTVLFRSLPDAKEIRFVFSREEMRWRPRSAY